MKNQVAEKAKQEMKTLGFPRDWMSDELQVGERGTITRSFRNSEFFTARRGEEDDDQPNFTGREEVIKLAKSHFSKEVLEAFTLMVHDQEKSWFDVMLYPKDGKAAV